MRALPSRYAATKPAIVKKAVAEVIHLQAPLKGLSLFSKTNQNADPLTAPILDNWVVEEDKISCRPGHSLTVDLKTVAVPVPANTPVEHLVPYYGPVDRMVAAIGGALRELPDGDVVKGGFTGNDWSWTAFSNLGVKDYTVMVNGLDGVWAWDGDLDQPGTLVTATVLTAAKPARITVAPADFAQFREGMTVEVSLATGQFATANGRWVISGLSANSFNLIGSDTSAASGTLDNVAKVQPVGSVLKQTVTVPTAEPWINPDRFSIVCTHMQRLWFADDQNLAVYYLPVNQKTGEVKVVPLNAIFRRGGHIRAIHSWSVDGGKGLDDQLVIFTTEGECAIYSGYDPTTTATFSLVGVFKFDSPMSKHCTLNYGGDLFVLTGTGLIPMTTMIRSETEQMGKADKNILSLFTDCSKPYRGAPGWMLLLDHSSGRMICNLPTGGRNRYKQAVRFMPNPIWSTWSSIPARCWQWVNNAVYVGTDDGRVLLHSHLNLSDLDRPITVDVQSAWSNYKWPGVKQFKMLLPYIITNGSPKAFMDVKVNYDRTGIINRPEPSSAAFGAVWDEDEWNVAVWARAPSLWANWTGVGSLGRVGAPRLTAGIFGCTFSLAGWDVLYEKGSVFG